MHSTSITIATVIAVVLIHVSYVDFRFRYREGLLWYWLLNPAPPIMWFSRATAVFALVGAFSYPFLGRGATFYWLIGSLVGLHILSLILLEWLEPR